MQTPPPRTSSTSPPRNRGPHREGRSEGRRPRGDEGSGRSASGTNFVNFKDAVFFLVTFKSDLGQFPDGEPAEAYEGKRIAVEGSISLYQGKPQIKLTDPKQVTVLAPDAVFPPPAETKEAPAAPTKPAMEKPAPAEAPATEAPKRKPPVDPSEYFKKKG